MDTRKYLAELVGTFLFLTIGYLSVAAIGGSTVTVSNLLVVPFSFGLGLLAATSRSATSRAATSIPR